MKELTVSSSSFFMLCCVRWPDMAVNTLLYNDFMIHHQAIMFIEIDIQIEIAG